MSSKTAQWLFSLCLVPLLALTAWCGWQVYESSTTKAAIKDDFSEANSIVYGLFSVDRWRNEVESIIIDQIDNFELKPQQDSLLRVQVSQVLHRVVDEAKRQVEQDDEGVRKMLRKWTVNALVDWDELRQKIPRFTTVIMEELTKDESQERLKSLAREKIDEYSRQTFDNTDSLKLNQIYHRYGTHNAAAFNQVVKERTEILNQKSYNMTYIMLGVVFLFLGFWFLAARQKHLQQPLFILSVVLALMVLLTGLLTPMIEIDARISEVNFTLLGQQLQFRDQMLFYRSKSILQVVGLLLDSSRVDSILVGVLVLAFSVLLPVSKLISTGVYLLSNNKKVRGNILLKWLAFKSGKWSMADVLAVAIFMAYVSFDGILDSQLEQTEIKSEKVTSISTNLTSLEPGFLLFLTYVLFGLIIAKVLEKIAGPQE